jgi:hypothetical protein
MSESNNEIGGANESYSFARASPSLYIPSACASVSPCLCADSLKALYEPSWSWTPISKP